MIVIMSYNVMFATVREVCFARLKQLEEISKMELNLTDLEKMYGLDNMFGQNISIIPENWMILDNQSTANYFCKKSYSQTYFK